MLTQIKFQATFERKKAKNLVSLQTDKPAKSSCFFSPSVAPVGKVLGKEGDVFLVHCPEQPNTLPTRATRVDSKI